MTPNLLSNVSGERKLLHPKHLPTISGNHNDDLSHDSHTHAINSRETSFIDKRHPESISTSDYNCKGCRVFGHKLHKHWWLFDLPVLIVLASSLFLQCYLPSSMSLFVIQYTLASSPQAGLRSSMKSKGSYKSKSKAMILTMLLNSSAKPFLFLQSRSSCVSRPSSQHLCVRARCLP